MSRFVSKFFLFKLLTVIVGAVDLGLVADSYRATFTERPFLSVVIIGFILSVFNLISYALNYLADNILAKRIEIAYHLTTGLLLFMTGSVFLFSVIEHSCSQKCVVRYLASFIGLINGFLYGLVAWTMLDVKIVSRVESTA